MTIVHLVDDVQYIKTNCYQHQLTKALHDTCNNIVTLTLNDLLSTDKMIDGVICCLRQRTVFRISHELEWCLKNTPIVAYDQDPWHSYMDDSPYKGTYDKIRSLNLKGICVTTEWWAKFLQKQNLPGVFVKMGMLPEYCDVGPSLNDRKIDVGFIGSLHPRRRALFEQLAQRGINVSVTPNSLGYAQYLSALQNIKIFIHNEDQPIVVDGINDNMGKGLWIKDVEAASRGCFSVRNNEEGAQSYCVDIPTIRLYDNVDHACDVINDILSLTPARSFDLQQQAVSKISQQDDWHQTAKQMISLLS